MSVVGSVATVRGGVTGPRPRLGPRRAPPLRRCMPGGCGAGRCPGPPGTPPTRPDWPPVPTGSSRCGSNPETCRACPAAHRRAPGTPPAATPAAPPRRQGRGTPRARRPGSRRASPPPPPHEAPRRARQRAAPRHGSAPGPAPAFGSGAGERERTGKEGQVVRVCGRKSPPGSALEKEQHIHPASARSAGLASTRTSASPHTSRSRCALRPASRALRCSAGRLCSAEGSALFPVSTAFPYASSACDSGKHGAGG